MSQAVGGRPTSISHWSRVLGVPLRPWSGQSPHSLLLRGIIQLAVCIFFLVLTLRFRSGDIAWASAAELSTLRKASVVLVVALIMLIALTLAKVLVGALDLIPRRSATGIVLSVRDRRLGDLLPRIAQRAIFQRHDHGIDQRRIRTEVVLETADGIKQWTIRNARTRRELHEGAAVQLVYSPLVRYVAQVIPVQVQHWQ